MKNIDLKNQKVLFALLGLWILVLGGVLFWQFNGFPDPAEISVKNLKARSIKEIEGVMRKGAEKQDTAICDQIKDEERREDCVDYVLINKALAKKDSSICEQIKNKSRRISCKDNVVVSSAIENRDKSLCDSASSADIAQKCKEMVSKVLGE